MNRRAAQLLSRGALRGLCKPLETGRSSLQSNMMKLRGGSSSNVFAYSTAKPPQKVSSDAGRGTTSGRVAGVASKSTASEVIRATIVGMRRHTFDLLCKYSWSFT